VDALLPDVQEAAISMGPAGRTSGQLQGGSRTGHRAQEVMPQGRGVLPDPHAGSAEALCACLQGPGDQRGWRT